jgi:GTPase SAR1 family protein
MHAIWVKVRFGQKSRTFLLREAEITIGKAKECTLSIPLPWLQDKHLVIDNAAGAVRIRAAEEEAAARLMNRTLTGEWVLLPDRSLVAVPCPDGMELELQFVMANQRHDEVVAFEGKDGVDDGCRSQVVTASADDLGEAAVVEHITGPTGPAFDRERSQPQTGQGTRKSAPTSARETAHGNSAMTTPLSLPNAAEREEPPMLKSETSAGSAPSSEGRADAEGVSFPERDRIVVIGRRQSGKTIYLASIYGRLWKSLGSLSAKALSGEAHKELMSVNRMLREGLWPPSTLGTSWIALEIEYQGKKRLLVTIDFAGELFSKAFVEEQSQIHGVRELLDHIDRAAAVILLVDPSSIAGEDFDATVDDDFGMVQAVQRIRNWPGGDEVPVVLVLTKMDAHQHLVDRYGGARAFVRRYFPALIRTLRQVTIFQISAVQVDRATDGRLVPRQDSALINIENPLRYCLAKIDRAEQERICQKMEVEERARIEGFIREEAKLAKRQNLFWYAVIVGLLLAGGGLITLILVYRI